MEVYNQSVRYKTKFTIIAFFSIVGFILSTIFIIFLIFLLIWDMTKPLGPYHINVNVNYWDTFVINDKMYYFDDEKIYDEKKNVFFDLEEYFDDGQVTLRDFDIYSNYIYITTSSGLLKMDTNFNYYSKYSYFFPWNSTITEDKIFTISSYGDLYTLLTFDHDLNLISSVENIKPSSLYKSDGIFINEHYQIQNISTNFFDTPIKSSTNFYVPNYGVIGVNCDTNKLVIDNINTDIDLGDNTLIFDKIVYDENRVYFATYEYNYYSKNCIFSQPCLCKYRNYKYYTYNWHTKEVTAVNLENCDKLIDIGVNTYQYYYSDDLYVNDIKYSDCYSFDQQDVIYMYKYDAKHFSMGYIIYISYYNDKFYYYLGNCD